jgi:hypothetical protein
MAFLINICLAFFSIVARYLKGKGKNSPYSIPQRHRGVEEM